MRTASRIIQMNLYRGRKRKAQFAVYFMHRRMDGVAFCPFGIIRRVRAPFFVVRHKRFIQADFRLTSGLRRIFDSPVCAQLILPVLERNFCDVLGFYPIYAPERPSNCSSAAFCFSAYLRLFRRRESIVPAAFDCFPASCSRSSANWNTSVRCRKHPFHCRNRTGNATSRRRFFSAHHRISPEP